MAKITGSLFNISGKVGDTVIRTRDGKPHIYLYEKSKKPRSKNVQRSNQKMSFCGPFCSALGKIRIIKTTWKNSTVEGRIVYNKTMKVNFNRVRPGYDISDCLLVPDKEKFETEISLVDLTESNLKVRTGIYPGEIVGNKRVSVQGVLQLTEPEYENLDAFMFLPVYTADKDFIKDMPMEFESIFSNQNTQQIRVYKTRKLLLNLCIKDLQGEPEKFSKEVHIIAG